MNIEIELRYLDVEDVDRNEASPSMLSVSITAETSRTVREKRNRPHSDVILDKWLPAIKSIQEICL